MKFNIEEIMIELNTSERDYGFFTYQTTGVCSYIYYTNIIIIDFDDDDSEYTKLSANQFVEYIKLKTKKLLSIMSDEI